MGYTPALSAEVVTAGVGGDDSGTGAVTDLTAHHRMAAERLWLTLRALGLQGPRRADTVAGHWFTQPRTTITGYKRRRREG